MDTTPVTLLERLRTSGDENAWRQLVALVTPLLLTWAHRVGMRRDDAADLAQDVLAVLVQKLPTFDYDPAQSFRAWLKTIAMNKWRERLRRPAAKSLDAAGQLDQLVAPDAEAKSQEGTGQRAEGTATEPKTQDLRSKTFETNPKLHLVASVVPLGHGQAVVVSADGHWLGTRGAEKEIVYVIKTAAGQETLSPREFYKRFGWKNDPSKVVLP